MSEEKIILTKSPIKDCCKYITDNINDILPFEVRKGYIFQIRMNRDTYIKLPDVYKTELKRFAFFGKQMVDDSIWKRYIIDHYWNFTKEYIFSFNVTNAMRLKTKCKYGYEGREDSAMEIIFLDLTKYPEFIRINVGLSENDIPKLPQNNKWSKKNDKNIL